MRRYEGVSTLLTSNRPVDDGGELLGDTAAVTALLDRLLQCPRAQMRAAQLAHETPGRPAQGRRIEVELTGLGRPLVVADFALSISSRFSMSTEGGEQPAQPRASR